MRNVVGMVPKAIETGLKQAQRDIQKRLGDLNRLMRAAGAGIANAADNAIKAIQPAARQVTKLIKAVPVVGWVWTAVETLFFGDTAGAPSVPGTRANRLP